MNDRSRYHHGDLRSALLDAAEALLAERGLVGFTLRECARRAGVSHAAPAHHFGNVTGVFTALAARGFERLVAALRAGIAKQSGHTGSQAEDVMIATIRAYIGFARREPELFRLMFRREVLDAEDPALQAASEATYAELTNVIRTQRGEAPLDADSLHLLKATPGLVDDVLIGWSHVHGLAHLLIEGQLDVMTGDDEEDFLACVSASNGARLGGLLRP